MFGKERLVLSSLSWFMAVALVSLVIPSSVSSARILVVPNQSVSHVRYFVQMSEPLIHRGHEVYAVMNGACSRAVSTLEKAGITVVPYYRPNKECFTENPKTDAFGGKTLLTQNGALANIEMVQNQARNFEPHQYAIFEAAYMERIKALKIDLCAVDGFILTLYNYILPYKLGVPYITLTTSFTESRMAVPGLTSFTPVLLSTLSEKMTFLERIENTALSFFSNVVINRLPQSQDVLVSMHAPEKPPKTLLELQRGSALWLLNTDVVMDYPRVSLPHIVHVGGLSTRPGSRLPDSLETIMDGATKGVILLSFGSLVKNLPDSVIEKILDAFRQLDDVTIVMKYNGEAIANVPPHVHVLSWLPQNDLLAHPAVRLFITHCGNNGQFEALYHGVPMLGMPVFGDQMYNAHRMAYKGFGKKMSLGDFTSEQLLSNIREIMSNESYSENIKKASAIFRSRPMVPTERAAYWVEHILHFGGDYLLSHGTKLPWYQYWLVDVALFLLTIALVVILALGIVIKVILNLICGRSGKVKTS